MATIAGSQFTATTPAHPLYVGFDVSGNVPPAHLSDFNLEVFVGGVGNAPALDPNYQGLAVLSPSGLQIDLITGAFAVTDNGTGNDTVAADGSNETITGGGAFADQILNGSDNTADGGSGTGLIDVNGTGNTVNADLGGQIVSVNTSGNTVNVGSGNNVINIDGDYTTVSGGSGADTIAAAGNNENISAGSGPELINAFGTGTVLTGGSGNDTLNVFGAGDTIAGGSGLDVLGAFANNVAIFGGTGPSTVVSTGAADTVTAGSGNMFSTASGLSFQFSDNNTVVYDDTVVGFSNGGSDIIQLAAGDTVATSVLVNGGQDTLITLSDNSTILLKGVADLTGIIR